MGLSYLVQLITDNTISDLKNSDTWTYKDLWSVQKNSAKDKKINPLIQQLTVGLTFLQRV